MQTVKRLSEDEVRKIIADHFGVSDDKVKFECGWAYEDWICEVEVE